MGSGCESVGVGWGIRGVGSNARKRGKCQAGQCLIRVGGNWNKIGNHWKEIGKRLERIGEFDGAWRGRR